MKKLIFLFIAMMIISCNETNQNDTAYAENNQIFNTHVETFKNHFLKGFEEGKSRINAFDVCRLPFLGRTE